MSQSKGITPLRSRTPDVVATIATPPSENRPGFVTALPNELLAEIFLAGREDRSVSPWSKEIPSEILITHVSHHWRILAHNTPRLWTSVIIDIRDKNHLENAADYIERSGALSLQVFVHMPHHGQLPLTLPAICQFISAEIERLQMLRVESNVIGVPNVQFLFENISQRAPHLQVLDIQLSGQISDPANILVDHWVFPDGLPSLKSVYYSHVSLRDLMLPQCPACTSLQLHQCAYHDSSLHRASHSFSSITELILSEMFPAHDWGSEVLDFPSLKALYMRYLPDYYKTLVRIAAPELDTMYLEAVTRGEMSDIITGSHSSDYNTSKFPRLRHFTLRLAAGRTLPYILWQEVMGAFQQVTHFTLLDTDIGGFLQSISDPGTSHVPWPMLEMLSLPHVEIGLLAGVISAVLHRANIGRPIRKMQLPPMISADAESFWDGRGVEVVAVVKPLAAFPPACRAEEWFDWDKFELS